MSVRWLGQPIVPFLTPLTAIPIGWPAGVPYPPPQPDWWPSGLQYPPIGEAWAPIPPPWWTNASASLPNWPPPPPAGWPSNFPWPVPPSTVSGSVSCPDICDAQFGPTGTAPNEQLRTTCKLGCGLAPPSQNFPIGPHNLAPSTPSTTTTPEKKSNTGLIVVGVLAAAAIAAFVVFGGGLAANPRRKRTKLDELKDELPPGYYVATYSPGDGVTRYRFFDKPGNSYFGPDNGIYTALGYKEAYSYARGLQRDA